MFSLTLGARITDRTVPDTPSTGVRRLVQLLGRNGGALVLTNLIFCLGLAPSAILYVLFLVGSLGAYALPLSLVAAAPVGGLVSACLVVITRRLGNDPGPVLADVRRTWSACLVLAMVPGLACTAFVYAQMYLWSSALFGGGRLDLLMVGADAISLLLFGMLAPPVFLQIAYLGAPVTRILQNSVILVAASPLHSCLGAVTGGLVWLVVLVTFPGSLLATPLLLACGFSVSWLLTLLWIWPGMSRRLGITMTSGVAGAAYVADRMAGI